MNKLGNKKCACVIMELKLNFFLAITKTLNQKLNIYLGYINKQYNITYHNLVT